MSDYRLAFELAPVGMVLSKNRIIVDCNQRLCTIFGGIRKDLIGQSFQVLYPTLHEYKSMGERLTPILTENDLYSDDRIMKRVGGLDKDELFWCHVTGRALDRSAPHSAGIWTFEDLSKHRLIKVELTPREREVAAHVIKGLISKEIGKVLGISPRTVEIHRAAIMRKYKASTTAELVQKLLTT